MIRESCRAIIFHDNKLIVMYREKNDRAYFTFPGGGKEENETNEECVKRECLEEFGITVEPQKEVYTYKDEKSLQHFYLCNWVGGELGSGQGEEFAPDRNSGVYIPTMMPKEDIGKLPLMPPEIAKGIAEDLNFNVDLLKQNTKVIEGKF